MSPLAIDLFCGLGGWTEGLMAEGYRVVGFDVERHVYGEAQYPAQLVLQDVLTIHGAQFKDAALIVASPPCQAYSYRAMPWKRAKALPPPDNSLFEACFRIQREACEAAGRHIPLVVENVCGAQKWVGRAKWHFGSFYLWGDVPALMPIVRKHAKVSGFSMNRGAPKWNMHHKECVEAAQNLDGRKQPGLSGVRNIERVSFGSGVPGGNARDYASYGDSGQQHARSIKNGGDWFGSGADCSLQRRAGSKSSARKAASAYIAKIPLPLSRHIARAWHPREFER
jgi:hypothetical protein